jgi:predicted ATP-grasp superfamily ATP-dependent carboligase
LIGKSERTRTDVEAVVDALEHINELVDVELAPLAEG